MSTHRPLHLPCLVVLTLLATTSEARLYRWVDEAGAVHYTDTLPPAQAERGHAEMSEKGLVVDTTERAKTPEELQREEEAKRARLAADYLAGQTDRYAVAEHRRLFAETPELR